MGRGTKRITALICSLAMVSTLGNAQSRGEGRSAQVVTSVLTTEAQQQRIEAIGTAEALHSVALYPATADRVTAIHFQPGDQVKQGQLLLELDARRQIVAVERAKIQLEDAKRTLNRLTESKAKGAVTQSALDDAETQKNLAEVTLKEATADLEDRRLLAPFDGVLGLTDVEVGDRINEQTLVTNIDDRSQLYINFDAPESAVSVLMQEPAVTLQPWTNRDQSLPAKVVQLDSRINESDRTLRARALLNNQTDTFRPGMSFRVSLVIKGQEYAVIPEAGLSWSATGAYIWLNEMGKAKRVDVQIKQRLKGRILVEGELNAGDNLIIEGIQRLREGQAVQSAALAGLSKPNGPAK